MEVRLVPVGDASRRYDRAALFFIAMEIVALPHRLPDELTRYLRGSMVITQQQLADRIGIARETVAAWETGLKELSPQHDLILRVLAVNHLRATKAQPTELMLDTAESAMATLTSVRTAPAPRRPISFRIARSRFKGLPRTQWPKASTALAAAAA